MSPIFNHQPHRFSEHRPAITEESRRLRKRADNVDNRNRVGSLLNRSEVVQSLVPQLLKKLIFALARPFVRPKNFRLHLLQFWRDKTLPTDGRLFAGIMRGHIRQIRLRHFNEIAEHRIVAHFERFDAGHSDFAFLQLADPILALA